MKIKFVLVALLVAQLCRAQDFIKAYIIPVGGDTLHGQVKLPGDKIFGKNVFERLNTGVDFKPDGGALKWYPPNDLREFGYYTGNPDRPVTRFVSETMIKNNRLLIIVIDGPLRLLKDYAMTKIGYNTVAVVKLYLKRPGQPILPVEDIYYKKEKDKGPIRAYLAGCDALDGIMKEKELDPVKLVNLYNERCK